MNKSTHFIGQPLYVQLLNYFNRDKILSLSLAQRCKFQRVSLSEQMYDTANQHIYDMLSGGKSLAKQQITERMAEKGLPSDTVL